YKKYSDDKEPFNIGKTLLDILEKNNINNTLCIVIRYYGGVKLGSSLKKAYTSGLLELINNNLEQIKNYININITFNYNNESLVNNILKNANIINKIYDNNITYTIEIEDTKYNDIYNELKSYLINK
ncbi:MAG TPA: YigZ family protein, partial [Bacilli bacterium]|nr:YigZ family protein [Bacilli bacterium]